MQQLSEATQQKLADANAVAEAEEERGGKGGKSPEKRMGKWAWNLVGTKLELFEDMSFDQVMTNIPFTFVIFSIKPTVNQVILWMDIIL